MTPHIQIQGLTIAYEKPREGGTFVAVADLELDVPRGTFVTIVGPSGCGKSSVLLAVAGLTAPSAGRVLVDGRVVTGPGRDRAMVFQEFALMPWRTVVENVRFGLELQRWRGEDLTSRAHRYVELVGLHGFEHYRPHQLSGGMRQRVGIARALAANPKIILMDEAFSELDSFTAAELRKEFLGIWQDTKPTIIMVTHLIPEAIELADRIAVVSPRPASIRQIVKNTVPRPRIGRSPEFFALEDELFRLVSPASQK